MSNFITQMYQTTNQPDEHLRKIDEKSNAEEADGDEKLKSQERGEKSNVNETIFDGKSHDIDT